MSVDTLTLAQRLRAAELPPGHAEPIGAAVLEGAATKEDVTAVRIELKGDIAAAKLELKSDLEQLRNGVELKIEQLRTGIERSRNQVVIGFVSTQIAFAGLIIAAVKLL